MMRVQLIILLVAISLAGCSTTQAIARPPQGFYPEQFDIGDAIKITTLTDRQYSFRVIDITKNGVSGDNVFIGFEDIKHLSVSKVDKTKSSTALFGSMLLVAAAIFLAIAAIVGPVLGDAANSSSSN